MRLQSMLGRISYHDDSTGKDMTGYLTVAKVLKVHHKSNTADVQVLNSKDLFVSSEENEGRFSALIVQAFAGYDEESKKAWGSIQPTAVGSYVLLAFLDNLKNRPIILGQFPRLDNSENIQPSFYPLYEQIEGFNRQEALKKLTVYPSQAYSKIDGESNIEFVHANKSFFAMFNETKYESSLYGDDNHLVLDRSELSESFESADENAKQPASLLYVHRTSFDDAETTWTKAYISPEGKLRFTRDNRDNQLSYIELEEDGTIRSRRQVDSPYHGESENYSEITHTTDGSIKINRTINGKETNIILSNTGEILLEHDSGSYIALDENLHMESSNGGKILSDSLSDFVEENHIIVSTSEPKNPRQGLVWIDLSN